MCEEERNQSGWFLVRENGSGFKMRLEVVKVR